MEIFNFTTKTKEELLKTGVYKIYHSQFPNKLYIGSASRDFSIRKNDIGFLVRWRKHLTELKNNKHGNIKLQRVVNKYGINGLIFDIVELCKSSICIKREIFHADNLTSYKNGYNLRKRADSFLGMKHKKSTKEKIRQANLGKIVSLGTRNLISKSRLGKPLSEEHKLKVKNGCKSNKNRYCYNKQGDLVKIFLSGRECENHFNLKKGKLWGYTKSNSYLNKEFLVFNENLNKLKVLEIINTKIQNRKTHLFKANKARLNKKIPS